jgi:hypothetical protein
MTRLAPVARIERKRNPGEPAVPDCATRNPGYRSERSYRHPRLHPLVHLFRKKMGCRLEPFSAHAAYFSANSRGRQSTFRAAGPALLNRTSSHAEVLEIPSLCRRRGCVIAAMQGHAASPSGAQDWRVLAVPELGTRVQYPVEIFSETAP